LRAFAVVQVALDIDRAHAAAAMSSSVSPVSSVRLLRSAV